MRSRLRLLGDRVTLVTVISEDLLSRGQAGTFGLIFPACPRARRNVEKLVSPCHRKH